MIYSKISGDLNPNMKLKIVLSLLIIFGALIKSGESNFYNTGRDYDFYKTGNDNRGSPVLLYKFLEQTLSPSSTVSMKCIARGEPSPSIKWKMDGFDPWNSERFMIGQYVTLNGDVISHFNISGVESEDSAEISCSATNIHGSTSHKARLNIFGPPFVRNFPASQNAISGKDFFIKCPASGYPIDEILWFKDEKQLPLSSRQLVSSDGLLTIKNVQKGDKGNYTCGAKFKKLHHSNSLFIDVVVEPKISYFRPETIVEEGARVVKYCESTGDGPLVINWFKNGAKIGKEGGGIFVQEIGGDIALALIIPIVTMEFSHANFTCTATNKIATVSLSTTLIVQVSPRVTKFNFPDEAHEGSRVSAHCLVSNSAEDVIFKWFKDGKKLNEIKNGEEILLLDKFSSILSIGNVSQINTGLYTCFASNPFGNSSHSAQLTVLVPPKWKKEPEDVETVVGEKIVLDCDVEAYPNATIIWKKKQGGGGGSYVDIPLIQNYQSSGHNIFSFPNGTLVLSQIFPSEQENRISSFVCEAENGIGSGISKLIHIKLNSPVKIMPVRNVTAKIETKAVLRCEIKGDQPISVSWYYGQDEINPYFGFKYQVKNINVSDGISSELAVANTKSSDDLYSYSCRAKNLCGPMGMCKRDSKEIFLFVLEPPDTPKELKILSKGSRFIQLSWKFKRRRNAGFTNIAAKFRAETGPWLNHPVSDAETSTYSPDEKSTTIGSLRPGTIYYFQIYASNIVGNSESELISEITEEEEPEIPPPHFTAVSISPSEIRVNWEKLAFSNGVILGYEIGHRPLSSHLLNYVFTRVESGEKYERVIAQLAPYTKYEVVIRAYNSKGAGPNSEALIILTGEMTPLGVEGGNCYSLSSTKIQISWKEMGENERRGLLRGYKIFIQKTQMELVGGSDELIAVNTTETSYTVENLQKYTTYEVQILAYNSKGDGEFGESIFCQTDEDFPSAPYLVKGIRKGLSSTIISWMSPEFKNGQITQYNIYVHDEPARIVPPNKTQIEVKHKSRPIVVYISASTKIGEGGNSSFVINPDGVSSTGGIVSFGKTIIALPKTEAVFECSTACGNPLRTWYYHSKIVLESERKSIETQGSELRIRNLSPDDSGNYSCFQTSYIWDSINYKNDRIIYSLVVLSPPTPPKLRENEQISDFSNSVSVKWSMKETKYLLGYFLHFKIRDEWIEKKIPRRLSSFTLRELSCGTTYPVYMTAYNKAGMSKASNILNISTKGQRASLSIPPEKIIELNTTWIRLRLSDSFNDGGCQISQFRVLYKLKNSKDHWKSLDENSQKSIYIHGLEENQIYQIKIIAENEAGKTEVEIFATTLHSSLKLRREEPSNDLMKTVSDTLQTSLFVPIIILFLVILLVISGLCFLFKRKIISTQQEEATADSFTYFKQNCSTSPAQQVYMTVKKSTPSKNTDFDIITMFRSEPQDDVVPYATFELRDRKNRAHQHAARYAPPEEHHNLNHSNAFYICNKHEKLRGKFEESEEEYESIDSDSDSQSQDGGNLSKHKKSLYQTKDKKYDKSAYETSTMGARYVTRYDPALNYIEELPPFPKSKNRVKNSRSTLESAKDYHKRLHHEKLNHVKNVHSNQDSNFYLDDEEMCQIKV